MILKRHFIRHVHNDIARTTSTENTLHTFSGLFSTTTWVKWHQKGKTNLTYWSKR